MENEINWQALSEKEKKLQLFLSQKATLDSFLLRGAISKAQYDKSYGDLKAKMGIDNKDLGDYYGN
ncbi:MAG: hypothetical protein IJA82_02255 [Clostridia bacterium]|nr:hypothetical protein [Clostridia bacterium]